MSKNHSDITQQVTNWVRNIIVKHNICPFAKKELERESIRYSITPASDITAVLEFINTEFFYLDDNDEVATTLVVIPELSQEFELFLDVVEYGNELLKMLGYAGKYQLAHMHPLYQFDGLDVDDAANYTNRSPYPLIHIIREDEMAKVLKLYPNAEQIPVRNIEYLRERGEKQAIAELAACFDTNK